MTRRKMTLAESVGFNLLMNKMGITNKEIYKAMMEDFIDSVLPFDALCKNPNLILTLNN